jgi:hypothetical protein
MFKKLLAYVKQWFSTPKTLADEAHAAKMALDIAGPGLVLVLQEVGVTNPEIASVEGEVSADLGKLDTVLLGIQEGTGGAEEVISVLESLKTNLSPLLDSAHIKDAATRARVTAAYNALVAEVETIATEFAPKG